MTHASRVGIQCLIFGVNPATAKILNKCSSSWISPESCHLKTFAFFELINNALDKPSSKIRDYTYDEKIVLEKYLGFYDGRSGLRTRKAIINAINQYK